MVAPLRTPMLRLMAAASLAAILIPSPGLAEDEVRLYQEPPSSTEVLYRLKGMKFRGAEAKATTYRAIKFAPPPAAAEEVAPAEVPVEEPAPMASAPPPPPPVAAAPAAPIAHEAKAAPLAPPAAAPPPPVVDSASPARPPARKGETIAFPAYFETGKWELTEEMKRYADTIGEAMQKDVNLKLSISGHTDATGGDSVNIPLSRKRAQAVKEYLGSRYQISPARITTSGYAAHQPINPDNPLAPENRRVQIQPVL